MDYCQTVSALLDVLILVFNKTDTMILSEEMLAKYQEVDELIQ